MTRLILVSVAASLLTGLATVPFAPRGEAAAATSGGLPPVQAVRLADMAANAGHDPASGNDTAQSRNAARSRMRECGHQWSTMKKSGAANGMTWKDFSQGCLAKQ